MRRVTRIGLLILLLVACALSLPSHQLSAQGGSTQEDQAETEGPDSFVPTERLPAGSAVSFPVDI
jgi:hypothetical protein